MSAPTEDHTTHHFGAIAQILTHPEREREELHPIYAIRHGDANLSPLDSPPKHEEEGEGTSRTGLSRALL